MNVRGLRCLGNISSREGIAFYVLRPSNNSESKFPLLHVELSWLFFLRLHVVEFSPYFGELYSDRRLRNSQRIRNMPLRTIC